MGLVLGVLRSIRQINGEILPKVMDYLHYLGNGKQYVRNGKKNPPLAYQRGIFSSRLDKIILGQKTFF